MILVTGATGNVGTILCKLLGESGFAFRAMTRDAEAAKSVLPATADIVEANYTDPVSLAEAMKGVSLMVLISPAHPHMVTHQIAALDAAKATGVEEVIKLSGLGSSLEASIRLPRSHAEIENHAKEIGLKLTAVRPNLFMQVLLGDAGSVGTQGAIYAPTADGKISFTDVRDIAEVFVTLIESPSLRGIAHDITGPEALTYAEAAAKIGAAAGHPVRHVNVPEEAAREAMLGMGFDPWVAEAFIELFQIYRAGYGADVLAENTEAILGKPSRSFDAFAADFRHCFVKAS